MFLSGLMIFGIAAATVFAVFVIVWLIQNYSDFRRSILNAALFPVPVAAMAILPTLFPPEPISGTGDAFDAVNNLASDLIAQAPYLLAGLFTLWVGLTFARDLADRRKRRGN